MVDYYCIRVFVVGFCLFLWRFDQDGEFVYKPFTFP